MKHQHYQDDHPIIQTAIWRELKRANQRYIDVRNQTELRAREGIRYHPVPCSRYSGGERAPLHPEWADEQTGCLRLFADLPARPPFTKLERRDPMGPYEPGNVWWTSFARERRNSKLSHDTIRDILWLLHMDNVPIDEVGTRYGLTKQRLILIRNGGGQRVDCGIYPIPEIGMGRRRREPWPAESRKFQPEHVIQMRNIYAKGYSLSYIARMFTGYYRDPVKFGDIAAIVKGETYKDVGGPITPGIRRERQATAIHRIRTGQTARERRAAFLYTADQIRAMRETHLLFGAPPGDLAKAYGGHAADVAPWLQPGPVTHVDPISGAETVID